MNIRWITTVLVGSLTFSVLSADAAPLLQSVEEVLPDRLGDPADEPIKIA
jgi:hypothetical protein